MVSSLLVCPLCRVTVLVPTTGWLRVGLALWRLGSLGVGLAQPTKCHLGWSGGWAGVAAGHWGAEADPVLPLVSSMLELVLHN